MDMKRDSSIPVDGIIATGTGNRKINNKAEKVRNDSCVAEQKPECKLNGAADTKKQIRHVSATTAEVREQHTSSKRHGSAFGGGDVGVQARSNKPGSTDGAGSTGKQARSNRSVGGVDGNGKQAKSSRASSVGGAGGTGKQTRSSRASSVGGAGGTGKQTRSSRSSSVGGAGGTGKQTRSSKASSVGGAGSTGKHTKASITGSVTSIGSNRKTKHAEAMKKLGFTIHFSLATAMRDVRRQEKEMYRPTLKLSRICAPRVPVRVLTAPAKSKKKPVLKRFVFDHVSRKWKQEFELGKHEVITTHLASDVEGSIQMSPFSLGEKSASLSELRTSTKKAPRRATRSCDLTSTSTGNLTQGSDGEFYQLSHRARHSDSDVTTLVLESDPRNSNDPFDDVSELEQNEDDDGKLLDVRLWDDSGDEDNLFEPPNEPRNISSRASKQSSSKTKTKSNQLLGKSCRASNISHEGSSNSPASNGHTARALSDTVGNTRLLTSRGSKVTVVRRTLATDNSDDTDDDDLQECRYLYRIRHCPAIRDPVKAGSRSARGRLAGSVGIIELDTGHDSLGALPANSICPYCVLEPYRRIERWLAGMNSDQSACRSYSRRDANCYVRPLPGQTKRSARARPDPASRTGTLLTIPEV